MGPGRAARHLNSAQANAAASQLEENIGEPEEGTAPLLTSIGTRPTAAPYTTAMGHKYL